MLRRRLLENLARMTLLVGSTAAALSLGELATRLLRPQQLRFRGSLYRSVDTIGYVRLPDNEQQVNTGERIVTIRTDRQGYRVGRGGRVDAETRVLIIGDSFMEALAVHYEESMAGLLQRDLPARLGRPVAVRNGGVSGYSPSQYLLATRRALASERFDLVLVALYTGNDIGEPHRSYFPPREPRPLGPRWPRRWTLAGFDRDVLMPLALRAQQWSHLAVLAWNSSDLLRIRLGFIDIGFPRFALRANADQADWQVLVGVCQQIAGAAGLAGAEAHFVIIPQYMQVDSVAAYRYARAFGLDSAEVDPDQPNRLLTRGLQGAGLYVLDALPGLRVAAAAGPLYGRADPHLNPTGNAVLASLVEPLVVERLAGHIRPSAREDAVARRLPER